LAIAKPFRLHRQRDFALVYRKGKVYNGELLVLRAVPNGLPHNRYAFVVSKKLGRAVVRNRLRRQLQEGLRTLPLQSGWDLVITAKAGAREAGFYRLRGAMAELLARARLMGGTP